jgi:flagellar basal body rod protein FlgG
MAVNGLSGMARTLSYLTRRQEITAHNIAQTNTPAFKAVRLAAHATSGAGGLAPVQWTDWKQGALRESGRPLDAALEGSGFFVVSTAKGERLSRGGPLEVDPAGRLVDTAGNPLLGSEGPIVILGSSIAIDPDGTVTVDGAAAGKLRLESVADLSGLGREDGGLFAPNGETAPVTPGSVLVRQGRIEEPNQDSILSLVDLVSIQRAYAANVQAMKALDGVLSVATSDVGVA